MYFSHENKQVNNQEFTHESIINNDQDNIINENPKSILNTPREYIKTGTTIVGLVHKTGIILASDTRSTMGDSICDKNCFKQHYIYDNIMACGAGTAADTDRVTMHASKELTLFAKKYTKLPRVFHAIRFMRNHLYNYGGHIGAALIVGGVDVCGKQLYQLSPHGYYTSARYTSMGSGSLAAISILENGYKEDMSREEGIALAVEAVKAGIMNDLYSGSNVDVCVIDEDEDDVFKKEILRNYLVVEKRESDEKVENYPLNSIKILKEEVLNMIEDVE